MNARERGAVEAAYGFPFPDDLYAFHAFARELRDAFRVLEIGLDGPLAVLGGHSPVGWTFGSGWPRYYLDPPEFFTAMTGHTDGLHWGYWFDAPGELPPAVAGYYHSDGLGIGPDGDSLFEVFRTQLELSHRDAEDYLRSDPKSADHYRERLENYARVREQLGRYALGERTEVGWTYYSTWWKPPVARVPNAPGGTDMGIVVPEGSYRPLSATPFAGGEALDPELIASLVEEACQDVSEGMPGSALHLGQELWQYRSHREISYELLDLAYEALGREILRTYLTKAIAFHRACDAQR